MQTDYLDIAISLLAALAAGSLIGLERSYHGRPAGFRTHALVCTASALLMLVSVYQWRWFVGTPIEAIRTDPTRMAQGIMTGIGFLGAGVIFKEGVTVRGLTTAASIWITAALGVLFGVGFYYTAILGTGVTLGVLACFRLIERRMPSQVFANLTVTFPRDRAPGAGALKAILAEQDCSVSAVHHGLIDGQRYKYRTVVRTDDPSCLDRLAAALLAREDIVDFAIEPTSD